MKKNKVLKCVFATILACGGIIATATSLNVAPVGADIEVSTADLISRNSENERVSIRRAATTGQLDVSKIYTQVGSDSEGASYLRFAAAVKGDIDSLVYSASIEGSDYQIADKVVTSVYKSIVASDEKTYYTGNSLVDAELLSTKDYYWACFTIKYGANSEFKDNQINVTLNVNDGEQVLTRSESLNNKLNPSTETNHYSLGDYITDCDTKGEQTAFTYTRKLTGHYETDNSGNKYDIPQGACSDGEYLYFAMNASEAVSTYKNAAGFVVKYNTTTNTIDGRTSLIGEYANNNKGPGNANLFYNPIDGMIYLLGGVRSGGAGGVCSDFRINPSDMSVENLGDILEVDGFKFETPDINTYFSKWASTTVTFDVENLEYNPISKKWAVIYRIKSNGTDIKDGTTNVFRQLFFYDSDMKLSSTSKQGTVVNNLKSNAKFGIQEMTSDSKYIYVDFTLWTDRTNSYTRMFDWNGNEIKEIKLSNTFADSGQANVQFVQAVGNELFIGAYQSDGSRGIYLTKVTYPVPSVTTTPSEGSEINLNLGETVEYANLKNKTVSLSSSTVKSQHTYAGQKYTYGGENVTSTKSFSNFNYGKGMTTDGTYIYSVLNAAGGSNDGNDIGVIAKYDTTGKILDTTDYCFQWGSGVRLGFFEGKLIVSRTAAKSDKNFANTKKYTEKLIAFNSDLTLYSDDFSVEGITTPSGAIINHFEGSADQTKLVVGYNYSDSKIILHTYEKDVEGKYVLVSDTTNVATIQALGLNLKWCYQVLPKENYIYLFFSTENGKDTISKPLIRVIDYSGNVISTNTLDSQAEGTTGQRNFQGFVEINNVQYYGIAQFAGSGYLTLNKLNITLK